MFSKKLTTQFIVKTAVVAGLYAALTLGLPGLSYGPTQFRISEAMTLLAFIDPLYIPGLTLGCALGNLGSPLGWVDVIIGSLATFMAVSSMHFIKKILGNTLSALILASLMPALFNGLIIGFELTYLLKLPFWANAGYVALGEFIVVSILGVVLFRPMIQSEAYQKILRF